MLTISIILLTFQPLSLTVNRGRISVPNEKVRQPINLRKAIKLYFCQNIQGNPCPEVILI